MRALAEFIMRGRMQACLVALAGNLVPLVSPATVGLVTLRHSLAEGLLVLIWACLPLLATLAISDVNGLIVSTSAIGMAVVMLGAEVLKKSVSWPLALMTVLIAIAIALFLLSAVLPAQSATLASEVQAVRTQMEGQGTDRPVSVFYLLMGATALGLELEQVQVPFVLGFLAWLTAMHAIASLILARWWQAMLYNPGGFQQEFHQLRFDKTNASLLMGALLACNVVGEEYTVWASLVGLPLMLAGLGLIHWVIKARGMKAHWLFAVYAGLIMFGPVSLVLIGIGFLDSFMNLRSRLVNSRG